MSRRSLALSLVAAALLSTPAFAIFVDGHGYYGVRGEARTKPENQYGASASQEIDQFFQLDTELRVNDKTSAFLEFKLFDNPRESYMGDTTANTPCPSSGGKTDPNCQLQQQSALDPHYKPYTPTVTKAYAQYSMDYCLLTLGRRGRQWGMGLFLDDGTHPFDTDASVFDGVTCDLNIQKSQTLGLSIGYDKISETGGSILYSGDRNRQYGPTDNGDDLDELYFSIEYNDHRANAGKGFSKQIGIYFANIVGGENTKTDIKIADLYLNFLISNLVWQNEAYFRLGKSADPNLALLGGLRTRDPDKDQKVLNDVQGIAIAGSLNYYLTHSGAYNGPKEYNQGNATSQSLFFDYAYAPGDKDGYRPEYTGDADAASPRDKKAGAIAFHRNFKPALLLFNGRQRNDSYRIDGIYDPYRVMNATVYSFGYRYNNLEIGNFEVKAVTASLNEQMPTDIKNPLAKPGVTADQQAAALTAAKGTMGYYGNSLGVELDFGYNKTVGKDFEFGFAGAILAPGDFQRTREDKKPVNDFLLQGYAIFHL